MRDSSGAMNRVGLVAVDAKRALLVLASWLSAIALYTLVPWQGPAPELRASSAPWEALVSSDSLSEVYSQPSADDHSDGGGTAVLAAASAGALFSNFVGSWPHQPAEAAGAYRQASYQPRAPPFV